MVRRLIVAGLGLLASSASAFLLPASTVVSRASSSTRSTALQMVDNSAAAEDEALKRLYLPKEEYLASLPEQGKSMQGMWEYVLVERMEKPSQTSGGLFLPSNEKDPYYIVRVVSLGTGVVGESGVTAVTQDLSPGDVAFTKQPWGIGPRDDTWETRKFSFVRAKDMLARIG